MAVGISFNGNSGSAQRKQRLRECIMAFGARGAVRPVVLLFAALLSASFAFNADARATRGIPKSAPAFTKFVARFIQDALPSAKVTVIGRLQLDVEAPNGGHTTDLHNVYSTCQRDPDICDQEVTVFVAQAVVGYKASNSPPTRVALRVVVRPSAYVAALRVNPKRNRPIAAPFAGDYWMIAVADRPASIAMLDENDLAALKLTPKDAFAAALANTRQALHQSLEEELAKGPCRGILGGDPYTASTVAFPNLWAAVAHRCGDNLLVSVPASDVVLYMDGSKSGALESITRYADKIVAHAERPFSDAVFRWSPTGWVPVPPPAK
jgi:hypothetical protein